MVCVVRCTAYVYAPFHGTGRLAPFRLPIKPSILSASQHKKTDLRPTTRSAHREAALVEYPCVDQPGLKLRPWSGTGRYVVRTGSFFPQDFRGGKQIEDQSPRSDAHYHGSWHHRQNGWLNSKYHLLFEVTNSNLSNYNLKKYFVQVQ